MRKKLLSFGLFFIMLAVLTGCSTSGSYYRNGKKYFVSGNYAKAAEYFSQAIDKNSNHSYYYIDYGMSLIALGQYEEAIIQFDLGYIEKDIKIIKENNKRALRGKGITYYNMKQYQKAIEQFDLALQIDVLTELTMDILYYKGSALMMTGSYEEATKVYTELLSYNEKNTDALFDRANLNRYLGEYEKGLADYDNAISLKPDCYQYYFGKYYLLVDNGKETEAAAVLTEAAGTSVKTKEDQYNLAKIQFYLGNYEVALTELDESVTNGFCEANYYIGEIYREKKEYETAIFNYEQYIKEGENLTPAVYNQLGACLMKLKNYKGAIDYLEKGIEYQQSDMLRILKKNEIIAYESLSMFDTALEKLQEYRESYPEDTTALREEEFLKTRLLEIKSVTP